MSDDIYTEPAEVDPDTLANLGPLAPLAGIWEGSGRDLHPVAGGGLEEGYRERVELQPIDPQLNGPQLLYGLRYHIHVVKAGEATTFHDQVGYWLWEPATQTVIQTVAIPRGQVALAAGSAAPDARRFTLRATHGADCFGICSATFLQKHFKTTDYSITITVGDEGNYSYQQETVLVTPGREPFHHTDGATLRRIALATPNPAAPRARSAAQ